MPHANKAHTATVNRIIRRYGGTTGYGQNIDIQSAEGLIEVETEATIGRGLRRLKKLGGTAYVAVTNKEAIAEALRATRGSAIGVMDPQGNILKPAEVR